ncbi:MAG: DUF362 domain-containing protein [Promethearchaeia archaeon]
MIKYNTAKYTIHEETGKLIGQEKSHQILKDDETVLVQRIYKGENLYKSVSEAFDKIDAQKVIQKGDMVAIKINLGGGIHGVPTTYSDPKICEAIIKKVKLLGGRPFVCEADMRAHIMNEKMLKNRGYYEILQKTDTEFVNLSKYSIVKMECKDLDLPLRLPEILLKPDVKIISFAPPKHHWECGITANQKNMYGAIAEQKKSIFHRKYDRIDRAVAAAARMMSPDINILATFDLGSGMGPHFCIPIEFNRMIISQDMIRGDKVAAQILGYPFRLIQYAMINSKGKEIYYRLHEDSEWPRREIIEQIKENSIDFDSINFWKPALWLQYFVPHMFQIKAYPPFEFLLTWLNKAFLKNQKVLLKKKGG